jgi:IS30 family transposase
MRLKERALEIRKMRRNGNGVQIVAKFFGVSVRTVQREVKRKGNRMCRGVFSNPPVRMGAPEGAPLQQ